MTDKFKAELREIILDMLADGIDVAQIDTDQDGQQCLRSMTVMGEHVNRLCDLADLGEWQEAQDELNRQWDYGERRPPWAETREPPHSRSAPE